MCVYVCIRGGGKGKESESVCLRASGGRSYALMMVVDGTGWGGNETGKGVAGGGGVTSGGRASVCSAST